MKWLILSVVVVVFAGCKSSDPPPITKPTSQTRNDGPAPIGSGMAGGLTPMTGTEDVQGSGGGGIAASAIGRARSTASGASEQSYTGNEDAPGG